MSVSTPRPAFNPLYVNPARTLLTWVALATAAASLTGCAGKPTRAAAQDGKPEGPSVVYARSEPGTVEINRDFEPTHPAEVLADIKDFSAKIADVRLQFNGIPLEVPMENVGGSTWRAQLTPRQLEMLSVSGRTIHYEADVVAHDEDGKIGKTAIPVEVAIKTPDVITGSG